MMTDIVISTNYYDSIIMINYYSIFIINFKNININVVVITCMKGSIAHCVYIDSLFTAVFQFNNKYRYYRCDGLSL